MLQMLTQLRCENFLQLASLAISICTHISLQGHGLSIKELSLQPAEKQ